MFFGAENKDTVVARINAIIGATYDETAAPDMTVAEKKPEGSAFSAVTFYLGDSPAYRFYYTGDTAPAYTFKAGSRTVTAVSGNDSNGNYLEVKVYAYEIPLGISFTDGVKTYEYNVYSYYAQAEASAKTLVERLVKYCESAEAYRQSVVNAD